MNLSTGAVTTADPYLVHESMEELYENAPCGYVSALLAGNIVRVNRTLLGWLGFRRDELVGKVPFSGLLSGPGRIFYETQFAPLLAVQGSLRDVAFDMVRRDGTPVPVLVSSVLRKDPSGRPLLHRTTVLNATDRRAYERELLLSNRHAEQCAKSLSHYLTMLGHDLKNPLNSILVAARELREKRLSPDDDALTGVIESAATGALRAVTDVLTFRLLEAGRLSLEERQFDLRQLVRSVTRTFEADAEDKGLVFTSHVGELVPAVVVGDPTRLAQVLGNLVGNAVKFTRHGEVSVDVDVAEPPGETVTLVWRVSDTGIGIERAKLGEIFEDFAQGSPDVGRTLGGCGLGLGICRRILRLHGASIDVESTPGRGSTFSFRIELTVVEE